MDTPAGPAGREAGGMDKLKTSAAGTGKRERPKKTYPTYRVTPPKKAAPAPPSR